jgi:hypothetical protein
VSTVLFGGATPKNGFSVYCGSCSVNDDGPASLTPLAGFMVFNEIYTTPFGYKPIGPVSVMASGPIVVNARAW